MSRLNRQLHRPAGRAKQSVILLLCALLSLTSAVAMSRDRYTESEVSIALLYNVTKFVRWPAATFPSETSPLKLCAFVSDDYQAPLEALEKRSVGSHPIRVVKLDARTDRVVTGCHVVFFASIDKSGYRQQLRSLAGQSVLTVGNYSDFLRQGGMLSLSKSRKRVNIRINAARSARAGIAYSSQLLELATVVKSGTEGGGT